MNAAGFVGAVLAPHHAENSQFGDVRIASENFLYAGVFFGGKAVFGGNGCGYFNFGFDHRFMRCH